jgi:glycosyltransferase involved in cell wall biosynthesis
MEVFIPTWNNERTIEECISALKRCSIALDITIVDNHSTDRTVEIAESLGADVVVMKLNLGEARTWICHHAKRQWFVMIDSDAIVCADWYECMIMWRNFLEKNDKRLGSVYCNPIEMPIVKDGKLRRTLRVGAEYTARSRPIVEKNAGRFGISVCLVRLEAVKSFSTTLAGLEDVLFGRFIISSGWNYYSLPVYYYHKPLLTPQNTIRRARIMGAYMRKIKYTSLIALAFNMIRVPIVSPIGCKLQHFRIYFNLMVGWLMQNYYVKDYKWGQG